MRILHTSDWHLGRYFHGVSLLEDQRHALTQIVDYVTSEGVDVVIIAGDIYDRSVPPAGAVTLLDEILHRLCDTLKVPVILIPGNHDGAERLRFGARQLSSSGLHILADLDALTEPVRVTVAGQTTHFFGIPYADPETVKNHFNVEVKTHDQAHNFLVERICQSLPAEGKNVLLSHCFVDGAEASESERPLSIGGSERVSFEPLLVFDYVALGHLHGPQFRGASHIRYSGSPLKYSFSEQRQKKSVTLVSWDEQSSIGSSCTTTLLPIQPLKDVRVIQGMLAELLAAGQEDPNRNDYLLVQLTDKHAILDPMAKLREIYPNVLHLEKPGLLGTGEQAQRRQLLKRGHMDMFADFFAQVQGEAMTEPQQNALQAVLEHIQKQARESA